MLRWERLDEAALPDGGRLALERRADGLLRLAIGGRTLMASDAHGSEEALAQVALRALGPRPAPRVLVGGLGMGFTLRAALDALPTDATVTVVEMLARVVDWCRGPLAPCSHGALDDPRARVVVADVADHLRRARERQDAILLDVDNGPHWEVQRRNQILYSEPGLRLLRGALRPGGVLAVWSADRGARDFERALARAGFDAHREPVRSRGKAGGHAHAIYVGRLRDPKTG